MLMRGPEYTVSPLILDFFTLRGSEGQSVNLLFDICHLDLWPIDLNTSIKVKATSGGYMSHQKYDFLHIVK